MVLASKPTAAQLPNENSQLVLNESKGNSLTARSMDSSKKVHVLSQVIIPGAKSLDRETISMISNKISDILKGKLPPRRATKDASVKTGLSSEERPTNIPTASVSSVSTTIKTYGKASTSESKPNPIKKIKVVTQERPEQEKSDTGSNTISSDDDNDFLGFEPLSNLAGIEKVIALDEAIAKKRHSKPILTDVKVPYTKHNDNQGTSSNYTPSSSIEAEHGKVSSTDRFQIHSPLQILPSKVIPSRVFPLKVLPIKVLPKPTTSNLSRPAANIEENVKILSKSSSEVKKSTDKEKKVFMDVIPDDARKELRTHTERSSLDQSKSTPTSDEHHKNKPSASSRVSRTKEIEMPSIFTPVKDELNVEQKSPKLIDPEISRKTQIDNKQRKVTDYFQTRPPLESRKDASEVPKSEGAAPKRKRVILNYNDLIIGPKTSTKATKKQGEKSKIEQTKQIEPQLTSTPVETKKRGRPKRNRSESEHESISNPDDKTETVKDSAVLNITIESEMNAKSSASQNEGKSIFFGFRLHK